MSMGIARILQLFLIVFLSVIPQYNHADDAADKATPVPMRLDKNKINGKGLTTLETPWPKRMLVSGIESHRFDKMHGLYRIILRAPKMCVL